VAAKKYADLRAAGARNPEVLANPNTTFSGYAVELVVPFGITEGFTPDHSMGFDLFWRDVDDDLAPQPGFGGAGIFWTDWAQATEVSGLGEDGNLFHGGNWGQIEFVEGMDVVGDFSGNGVLDAPDIDDLTQRSAAATNPEAYDLNSDALVNEADVKFWIKDLYGSWVGDANLDNEFNSSDLVTVLASGKYEVNENSTWSSGDFNGDGRTNSTDLVAALADGGYELGPPAATAAVPEPAAINLLLLGVVAVVHRRRVGRSLAAITLSPSVR
jgi:hypothetical protein